MTIPANIMFVNTFSNSENKTKGRNIDSEEEPVIRNV